MDANQIQHVLNSIYSESKTRLFIMLVGAPCSNKTQLAEYLSFMLNIPIVSPNDIRKRLLENLDDSDDFDQDQVFEIVFSEMKDILQSNSAVIYDSTNCYPKWRKYALNELVEYYNVAVCIQSYTTLTNCIVNNVNNGNEVPERVVEKMYYNLEKNPPNLREGFDVILRYMV